MEYHGIRIVSDGAKYQRNSFIGRDIMVDSYESENRRTGGQCDAVPKLRERELRMDLLDTI